MVKIIKAPIVLCGTEGGRNRALSLLLRKAWWASSESPKPGAEWASVCIPLCFPSWTGFWVPKKIVMHVNKGKSTCLCVRNSYQYC